MGILSGPEIRRQVQLGRISIEPFRDDQVNPASYDLRLGDQLAWYIGPDLDAKREHQLVARERMAGEGFVLEPGRGYLMHTEEVVGTECYVPVLDGKSSIGRLFISVHATAGYGDPGFLGQYTLEVTVTHPVRVYAGMRVCQIRFHELVGERLLYSGNYQGGASMGPVPSRSWRQFDGR